MSSLKNVKLLLHEKAEQSKSAKPRFFKIGSGDYAEHDKFICVSVPDLRRIANSGFNLEMSEIEVLIKSSINEERLLALLILCEQYRKGTTQTQEKIYRFYIDHLKFVNNWNLIDGSAPLILGVHLFKRQKEILISLAKSQVMWERRIAIMATHYFIRQASFEWTFKVGEILLQDAHELIHKAVGWMLREVGKRDESLLREFLDKHTSIMPRTMLRYSIEKFAEPLRQAYLKR